MRPRTNCGLHALFVAALLSFVAAQKSCFYPDKSNATGLTPCRRDAEVTHCCKEGDECLSNGLCYSAGLNSVVRRGCTDKTWTLSECPNYGTAANLAYYTNDAPLSACGGYNSFCCGQDGAARRCCEVINSNSTQHPLGILIKAGAVITGAMDKGLPSPTPCGPNGTSSAAALKSKQGAVIGLGTALGAVALVALGVVLFLLDNSSKQEGTIQEQRVTIEEGQRTIQDRESTIEEQRAVLNRQEARWARLPFAIRAENSMEEGNGRPT
ncbi:hypothetical protein CC80DRAFT_497224 [Byssothecium circinans]|uniref:Uncharacterized protein n=1 Tax=Byssothecium circinans TaxID=147558 RepID=A0A6A5TDF3_9PLEO|nr:hypothetical protein CC80DRAFT_497224 [Byssothecium circinans]